MRELGLRARRLRAAVVGLGVSGSWTIEAFAMIGRITCVAGVDPRGSEAPGSHLVTGPTHRSIEELNEYRPLDLVVICTGTPDHAEAALAALELTRPGCGWRSRVP